MGYTILKQDTIPACAGLKMASEPQTISTPKEGVKDSGYIDRCDVHELFVSPLVCGHNYMELFRSVPEVLLHCFTHIRFRIPIEEGKGRQRGLGKQENEPDSNEA